jgi:pimeloyl-ACP methyl ester carboxylesterase
MVTLKVPGVVDRVPEPSELGGGLPDGLVTVKHAARVQQSRAGGADVTMDALQPTDIVEIELQDGLRIWSRVEDLEKDLNRGRARSEQTDTIRLSSELQIGPASRSFGGWAMKGLKVLGLNIDERIAQFAASHVEGKLTPGPGLYRCSEQDPARLEAVRSLDGKGPVLLFLHGTASSTSGSFSGLWTPQGSPFIQPLFKYYEGRVLAYQHRTLTESPIENTLALVQDLTTLLGSGSEVHVVSHSRGGLVGELLARGMRVGAAPFTPDELALFEDGSHVKDRDALDKLSAALAQANIRLTRFVRVACPARGTTLADGRLDRYFSVLVNAVSLIPGLKGNPVYDGLTSLLAGVLKQRTEPRELPGLEAMMPTSPLVRMLNNPEVRTSADLHVLGGDLAGVGVFGRLKTLATDLYYRDDHDVVVNTPAMLGGMERTNPVRYWIDTGDQVTHFHYFARADTARRLVSALTGSSADFRTLATAPSAVKSSDYVKRAAISRPVVFVLPGIMGSQLTLDDQPVWMSTLELARGGLSRLAADARGVKATGLLTDGYADLCAFLQQSHEVMPFPYDWRQSLDVAAEALREAIDTVLPFAEAAGQPVRLLAHSMGGLVVRTMLAGEKGSETWARMCKHAGARFIMLGTPNRGSFSIPAMLMGRDALVKKLALIDLKSSHSGILATIAGFEGVLNLLPHDGDTDFFDTRTWERLLDLDAPQSRGLFGSSVASSKSAGFRWAIPGRDALDKARRLAATLRTTPLDPARVLYVAGAADETACGVEIDEAAVSGRKVKVLATSRGDGRVLWETGIPKGITTFYMDTVHGDMANDRRHFAAIADLLNTGATSKLDTTPKVARSAADVFELRDPMPSMVPDESELVADALGGQRVRMQTGRPQTRIHVGLTHDNLTNAKQPVLVSHYMHDVIVAAEKYLDRQLDGRLSELLRMELYPGPINTGIVVLNDASGDAPREVSVHPGAIVAGLGRVGELTPGALTSTLTHALTMYGAECVGRERRRQHRIAPDTRAEGTVSAPVTAILIGSGEGGLTLADSVRALLRAVLAANERLSGGVHAESTAPGTVTAQIDSVTIIELYEDRAIEAAHTLRKLAEIPEFAAYVVDPLVNPGKEGIRRARIEQGAGWWQRVRITSSRKGQLKFEAITQSARAPARLRPTQRSLVDGFIKQALETTASDASLGHTLFELLVPNDFKPYAPDRQKLALMLNADAAGFPWELMRDGFGNMTEPLSVASGMIRQLLVDGGRQRALRAPGRTALVVGNPKVSDQRFPTLVGATLEASTVDRLLRDAGYDVQLLLEEAAAPMAVLTAIHRKPWRILHLAAHGVFEFSPDKDKPPVSGLVLDDGLFFTAAEADQMRYVPELVFINCCHLGQTRGDAAPRTAFHKLAANLATQFITMGARAVVAAGWEVNDAAAKTFAGSFYRAMLQGDLFGDAVLQARKETFDKYGQTNTWGAYQCYGDISFSLRAAAVRRSAEVFVSLPEWCMWLEGVARSRESGSAAKDLLAELTERTAAVPASWRQSADLCALMASAFAKLGHYQRAVEYYDQIVLAEEACAPVKALEQLANYRVRWAEQLRKDDPDEAVRQLNRAESDLKNLLGIGATSERWSLLAGVMKRRALLTSDPLIRREALREMRSAYSNAFALSADRDAADPYPLANWIAAEVVLSWQGGDVEASLNDITRLMNRLQDVERARAGAATDTFNLVAPAERLLLEALVARQLDESTIARIGQEFSRALSRGASQRELGSIQTQLGFFRDLMKTEFPDDGRDRMIQQLTTLEEQVLRA